jgi:hypothetical protein
MNDVSGYLRDVTYAWRSLEDESATSVGLETRYALIAASINSLAKNIPPSLLVALVKKNVWASTQALAYVRQMPDPQQRAVALIGLALQVNEPLEGEVLREALTETSGIRDGGFHSRHEVLAMLAPSLSKPLLPEALRLTRTIKMEFLRSKPLTELAIRLAELGDVLQALATIRTLRYKNDPAWALARVVSSLPGRLEDEVPQEAPACCLHPQRCRSAGTDTSGASPCSTGAVPEGGLAASVQGRAGHSGGERPAGHCLPQLWRVFEHILRHREGVWLTRPRDICIHSENPPAAIVPGS